MSDDNFQETQAQKIDVLAINAATCDGQKYVLLTARLNPYTFETTELLVPVHQAIDRLQIDLSDLLQRSPVFNDEENNHGP